MDASENKPALIRRVLREPLFQFFVIGMIIYAVYAYQNEGTTSDLSEDRIVHISAGDIVWMKDGWAKRWGRDPTAQELQGLIDAYSRELILSNEAKAMGLEENDTVIRRRLVQKLTFIGEDLIRPVPATEEELENFYGDHMDRYMMPSRLTMVQVFVDPDKREDTTLADADTILTALKKLTDPLRESDAFGDKFFLQSYYPEREEAEISKDFGGEFAASVFAFEPEKWHGPVLSGYGVHLVYISTKTEAREIPFEEVHEQVQQEWEFDARKALNEVFINRIMDRYEVVVDDAETRTDNQ
ncbi:MAG: peptidyl-prolyl cis-trans isomerase [Paracoccaceae bacterium]